MTCPVEARHLLRRSVSRDPILPASSAAATITEILHARDDDAGRRGLAGALPQEFHFLVDGLQRVARFEDQQDAAEQIAPMPESANTTGIHVEFTQAIATHPIATLVATKMPTAR